MLEQLLLAELSGSVEADGASPVPADRDPGAIVELGELVDFNAQLILLPADLPPFLGVHLTPTATRTPVLPFCFTHVAVRGATPAGP